MSTRMVAQYSATAEFRAAQPRSDGPPAPLNPTAGGDWRLATPSEVIETFELLEQADRARSLPDATQARMAAVAARAQDERERRDAARAERSSISAEAPKPSASSSAPAAPSPSALAKMFDTTPQPATSTVVSAA